MARLLKDAETGAGEPGDVGRGLRALIAEPGKGTDMGARLPHGPMPPLAKAGGDGKETYRCIEGCGAEVSRKGGRCRSCGIRYGKHRAAAAGSAVVPASAPPAVPAVTAPEIPRKPEAVPVEAGPVTVALAKLIEGAAAASARVESRMVVDRTAGTIHIEVDLS